MIIFLVTACSSGDSAETDTYIKFYNASADAPSIFMTLDEDLDNDADDELERTYSAVAYGYAGSDLTEYHFILLNLTRSSQLQILLEP